MEKLSIVGRNSGQMTEANQKMDEDHYLCPLLTQLDDLAKKILEVEVSAKENIDTFHPHVRTKPKEN